MSFQLTPIAAAAQLKVSNLADLAGIGLQSASLSSCFVGWMLLQRFAMVSLVVAELRMQNAQARR